METINIKGKEYIPVNERIKFFREHYPDWSLTSEIISLENGICVIKATIKDENEIVKATGLAFEKESSSFINKTSYIENCETSAWGRALGNLGIGIDVSIASAEEVQNAVLNQGKKKPDKEQELADAELYVKLAKLKEVDEIKSYYEVNKDFALDKEMFHKACCSKVKDIKDLVDKYGEGIMSLAERGAVG